MLLNVRGVESASLTLEGHRPDFSLGVQLGVFPVRGKRKESVGFVRWKAKGNRLVSPVLPRFHSDFSRLQRDSADSVAIAEQSHINSREIATDSNLHTCRKRGCNAGRMCEVGPPASGLSFFTFPYSHLAVLNGNHLRPGGLSVWPCHRAGAARPPPGMGTGRIDGFAHMRFGLHLGGSDGKLGQTLENFAVRHQASCLT